MAGAHMLFENVPGAPFIIGQKVRVIRLADGTTTPNRLGQVGHVRYLEYECGCGQTYPSDPMIGVEFDDGSRDEFWKEELQTLEPQVKGGDKHGLHASRRLG